MSAAAIMSRSDDALRQAETEGLTLLKADNSSGHTGVYFSSSGHRAGAAKPYSSQVWRGGKQVFLGSFASVEEAALCYARTPEAQAAVAVAALLPPRQPPALLASSHSRAPPPRPRRRSRGAPSCRHATLAGCSRAWPCCRCC